MARNDRIPQGIRKEINKIGPGKYCDPETGRIYVDSADMDDSFEQMQDDVRNADAKRDAIKAAEAARPKPPDNVREQADAHLLGMAQRFEDTAWVGRAKSRREHLLGRQRWKRSIGAELEPEDLEELAELESALHTEEAMEEAASVPEGMQELVDALWGTLTSPEADDPHKLTAAAELGGLILSEEALPIPAGYKYDAAMFKDQVFKIGEAVANRIGDAMFEPLLRETEDAAEGKPEDPPKELDVAFEKAPGDSSGPATESEGPTSPATSAPPPVEVSDTSKEEDSEAVVPGVLTLLRGGPAPFDGLKVPVPADMVRLYFVHDPVEGSVRLNAEPIAEGGLTNSRYEVHPETRTELGQIAEFIRNERPTGEPVADEPDVDDSAGVGSDDTDGHTRQEDEDAAADEKADAQSDDGRMLEI